MHVQLRFFARIREALGTGQITLELSDDVRWTPRLLAEHLASENGELWGRELLRANTLCAVNRTTVDAETALSNGDEVAFFPPVTGG